MVADEYIVGRPARISREAPVLILHHASTYVRPGGATNTANNIRSLGAQTAVAGVIGDDEMGRRLRSALEAAGIHCDGLIVDPGRPTSTKTRIVGKGTQEVQQQIVRVDRVDTSDVDGAIRNRMIDAACRLLDTCDAVLVSDYENGVISPEVIDAVLPECARRHLTVTVDSHGDLFRFRGVTSATPNQPEAELTLGRSFDTVADLEKAGWELVSGMDAQGVLITRGSEGASLFERGEAPYHMPISLADDSEVVDPTGAGDAVAAVFTLAVAGGATMQLAAYLGNIAGGVVVRRPGTATLSRDELAVAAGRTQLPAPV